MILLWLAATVAAAQTQAPESPQEPPGLEAEPETTPTLIPEIPAEHADPMDREPDPAAGTPAAEGPPQADEAAEHRKACDELPPGSAAALVLECPTGSPGG